jgi:branched-chain amino acid transport system substrate-binding protein
MKSRLISVASVGAIIGFFLLSQSVIGEQKSGRNEPIKLGFEAPLTGAPSYLNKSILDGIYLAMEEVNRGSGILGRKVELVVFDDACDLMKTTKAWLDVFKEKEVDIALGSFCYNTLGAAAKFSTQSRKLLIPLSMRNEWLLPEYAYPYTYPISLKMWSQAEALSDYLAKQGIKKITLAYSEMPGAEIAIETMEAEATKKGISIDASVEITGEDLTPAILKLKQRNPEGVIVASDLAKTQNLIQISAEMGLKPHTWGSLVLDDPNFTKDNIESFEGVIFPYNFAYSTEEGKNFVSAFRKRYGYSPYFSAKVGYDTVHMLKAAIESTGSVEAEKIKRFLEESIEEVIGGFVVSKANRFCYNDVYLVTPKDGQLVLRATYRGIGKGRR